jgi:hypothetical protein
MQHHLIGIIFLELVFLGQGKRAGFGKFPFGATLRFARRRDRRISIDDIPRIGKYQPRHRGRSQGSTTAQWCACAALAPDQPRRRSAIRGMSLVDRSSVQAEILGGCFGLRERDLYHYHSIDTARCGKSATKTKKVNEWLVWFAVKLLILLGILVALPGLEPGLFALRGRFWQFAGTCTEAHHTQ